MTFYLLFHIAAEINKDIITTPPTAQTTDIKRVLSSPPYLGYFNPLVVEF